MTTSLYTLTKNYIGFLGNMEMILQKAKVWKEEKKISDEALCNARLAIDQFPLTRQIQIMTDHAKKSAAIIAGVDVPVYEDTEKTLDELIVRVQKTKAFLESLPKDVVASDIESKVVPFPWVPGKGFTAQYYLEVHSMSNFYFHLVTAYSILRHIGLSIGKTDYTGPLHFVDLP